ncbi:DNA-binding response regulator [Sulfitobacter sp. HI0082]|jgi:two-component system response regulator BaeR|uniref:response regulator n=1 Tax=unclassified Sulfitobacter TaxID=196795 RepID=UPI0007C285D1|nr:MULTISPECIES: response regulator [unclassified Sulfitobacter]KZX98230.1 DNA-binding response regulator [Sulfitobacter sp. HI0021]KZY00325.1 DNA-binding response regulator [Sulfitobacter sp. HI0027]KZZ04087.1 DNA-binding response regulator [Sulfitobacter sp. HI0076]KZZ28457.1 DNA-binding response regulator [Sulfitobacter sp. HI0082]|tara:strand:- start:2405 stop:3085 length:681 start_codon:yes stop_codon:yes gene_type:complete
MTVASILIVEDEIALAEVVRDYLLVERMHVDMLTSGAGAVELIQAKQYDLVILDLMLPEVDGLTICRELRKASDVPIIMTTAKVEEIDRLLGLEMGADDYLCKPYSPRELVARVRAVLRRRPLGRPAENPATNDRLIIDAGRWQATLDGSQLDLTRREFSLLQALASRPGRVFSRDQLLSLAFPNDTEVFDRTIDSHIRNIRRKIASVSTWDPIRSVYGVGYAYDG